MTHCLDIPIEVLFYLCQYLPTVTIILLAKSCKQLRHCLLRNQRLWRNRYLEQFSLDDFREREWYIWYARRMRDVAIEYRLSKGLSIDDEHPGCYVHWYDVFCKRQLTKYNWQRGRYGKCSIPLPNDINYESVWVRAVSGGQAILQLTGSNKLLHVQYPYRIANADDKKNDNDNDDDDDNIHVVALPMNEHCIVRDIGQVRTTHLYTLVWAMLEKEEMDTSRPKLIRKVREREYTMMAWISGIRRRRRRRQQEQQQQQQLCNATEHTSNYKWSMLPGWTVNNTEHGIVVNQWVISFQRGVGVRAYHLGKRRWCNGNLKSATRTIHVQHTDDDRLWIYSCKQLIHKQCIEWQVWEFNMASSFIPCIAHGRTSITVSERGKLSSQRAYDNYALMLYRDSSNPRRTKENEQRQQQQQQQHNATIINGDNHDDINDDGEEEEDIGGSSSSNYIVVHPIIRRRTDEDTTWQRDDLDVMQVRVAITVKRLLVCSPTRQLYILDIRTGDMLHSISSQPTSHINHILGGLFIYKVNAKDIPSYLMRPPVK
ncbi:hypothetical protein BDF22DRAFT_739674 [Syncephalis plumigaleata]|nr:hypothetical protein BDF22DRAFT_739674 [Syncephalis plumigaleata]